jgi:hypothetical protein
MTTYNKTKQECFKVSGEELFSRIKEILVLAPHVAAICAIAAMAKDWTIIVEKKVKQEAGRV